jgi:hypothetical protein
MERRDFIRLSAASAGVSLAAPAIALSSPAPLTTGVGMFGPYTDASQYATLQLAVDAAGVGGVVYLKPGTYIATEVILPEGILILGAGANTIITNPDLTKYAFKFTTPISLSPSEKRAPRFSSFDLISKYGVLINNKTNGVPTGGVSTQDYVLWLLFYRVRFFTNGAGGRGGKAVTASVAFNALFESCYFAGYDIALDLWCCDTYHVYNCRFQSGITAHIKVTTYHTFGAGGNILYNQFLGLDSGATAYVWTADFVVDFRFNAIEQGYTAGYVACPIVRTFTGIGSYNYSINVSDNSIVGNTQEFSNLVYVHAPVYVMYIFNNNIFQSSPRPPITWARPVTYWATNSDRTSISAQGNTIDLPFITPSDYNGIIPGGGLFYCKPGLPGLLHDGSGYAANLVVNMDHGAFLIPYNATPAASHGFLIFTPSQQYPLVGNWKITIVAKALVLTLHIDFSVRNGSTAVKYNSVDVLGTSIREYVIEKSVAVSDPTMQFWISNSDSVHNGTLLLYSVKIELV